MKSARSPFISVPIPCCAHSITCWSDPFPLYSESRRIIPNSATAAVNFKSLEAAEKSNPVSLTVRRISPTAASLPRVLSCSFAVNSGSAASPAPLGICVWEALPTPFSGTTSYKVVNVYPAAIECEPTFSSFELCVSVFCLSYPINRYDATRLGLNSTSMSLSVRTAIAWYPFSPIRTNRCVGSQGQFTTSRLSENGSPGVGCGYSYGKWLIIPSMRTDSRGGSRPASIERRTSRYEAEFTTSGTLDRGLVLTDTNGRSPVKAYGPASASNFSFWLG